MWIFGRKKYRRNANGKNFVLTVIPDCGPVVVMPGSYAPTARVLAFIVHLATHAGSPIGHNAK
jgi:hypothetical protein